MSSVDTIHERKMLNLKGNKKKDYLLCNINDLFKYYDSKKNVETNNTRPSNILNSFFFKETNNVVLNDISDIKKKFIRKNNFNDVNVNEYMYDASKCDVCKGEMIKVEYEGSMICKTCFVTKPYLIENDTSSYTDNPKEVSFYAYKRLNHFKEILNQFQAKETTHIPAYVIDSIKSQIKKERLDIAYMSHHKMKTILKKLKFNRYYEHIYYIKNELGINPLVMSNELENTLCSMFVSIQSPYSKICPKERVNFLNYYFTLYKLCELLGETTYLQYFPMLKEQKRREQDVVWRKICVELNWQYFVTT